MEVNEKDSTGGSGHPQINVASSPRIEIKRVDGLCCD